MTTYEAAQQILQHATLARLSPKDWADKFNKFNPKLHIQRGPMTFDPTSIKPPVELMAERMNSLQTHHYVDYTFFARWGAAQAVEALRHQWPEPITNRPPTEEDGDDSGLVQVSFSGRWFFTVWEKAAMDQRPAWLHTPNWRPKPEPTLKEQALALLNGVGFDSDPFTAEQVELLRQVVQSAPDTTP